jgi:hypothetical protein
MTFFDLIMRVGSGRRADIDKDNGATRSGREPTLPLPSEQPAHSGINAQ